MILKYVCPDYRVKSLFDISAKWLKRNEMCIRDSPYTSEGRLLGHITMSCMMVQEAAAKLRLPSSRLGIMMASHSLCPAQAALPFICQGSGSSERIGGYDQFIYLLFCVLEIIYVPYFHLCCFIVTNDFILSVLSYYNMIDQIGRAHV